MSRAAPPIRFEVRGACVSLKNSRDIAINRKTGRAWPKRNAAIESFTADFCAQIPPDYRGLGIEGDVSVTIDAFYPDRRRDLDVELVYDLLGSKYTGVIRNDRQVKEKHVYWHLDRDNPRVSVIVREL